ncbi:MAG: response regulator [Lachnospiraceae bacterium]|nr:response regulator [Lachnospiraceae bacterium]
MERKGISIASGFSECVQGYYFAKPMPVTEYEDLLKNQCLVCDKTDEEKALHRGSFVPGLLVIDEDDIYREVVRTAFEEQFTVLEATDSESGLACIKKYGRDMISIVILSLSLPEEGAAFFLKALRQKMMLWQVPVLATIPGEGRVEEMPLALETDDFLCKSHPLWDLHKRVECLMGMAAAYKYEITLQDETNRDKMTGLLNRRGLEIAMNSLWKEYYKADTLCCSGTFACQTGK